MADRFFKPYEHPKYPHLNQPGGGYHGEFNDLREDLSRAFARVDTGAVSQTSGVLHVYANGTSGSDTINDGLSLAKPKKSLHAVFDLVPYFGKHNICVHLGGIFSAADSVGSLDRYVDKGVVLVVDGGSLLTVVADNAGSPWISNINSVNTIGLSTAGWSADAYAGYLVDVVTGPAIGQTRLIQSNSTTTLTVSRSFSVDPGVGATFRISRYTTTITDSVNSGGVFVRNVGPGIVNIQRLYMAGTSSKFYSTAEGSPICFSNVVCNSSYTYSFDFSKTSLTSWDTYYDPTTFVANSVNTLPSVGLSQINASGTIRVSSVESLNFSNGYAKSLIVNGSLSGPYIFGGSRIITAALQSCIGGFQESPTIVTTTGYAPTRFGGGVTGITILDSSIRMGAAVNISNCSSHAISCTCSKLFLDGIVVGSTNIGAGVYANNMSLVQIKNGSPPTITGTMGDCSTDGANPASTWTIIDGGISYTDLTSLAVIKEVP